jgi:DNA-binding NarL/FixJ family response regulator
MQPIRILLVDDQTMFREGLRVILSVQPDFEVVGEAANGEEALRMAVKLKPHVVLMDLRMPVMDGVEATRRLHASLPKSRVIMLTTFDDDEMLPPKNYWKLSALRRAGNRFYNLP